VTSSHPPPAILNAWRTLIEQRDSEAVCFWAICLELHTRVFPGFAPPPGRADTRVQTRGWTLARELTAPLWRVALAKLASRFPKDAAKGLASLIRWHMDDAYACCAQAVEWATDLLLRDLEEHPSRFPRGYLESWHSRTPTGCHRTRAGARPEWAAPTTFSSW
jgi:hypothetical protein